MKTLNEQDSNLRWTKFDNIENASFVHDNVLLIGGDNSITFINLNDGTSTSQKITGQLGDGISCFVGHKLYDIFALCEACINPRIILYSQPDLKLINTFQRKSGAAYLTMKFSETEHLIAITGLPKYELEIWNWRTGKLLVIEQTDIKVDSQVLRVSHSFPLTITQYNKKTGKINFWEVYISMETAKLIKRKIKCPFQDASDPYEMCYGVDGCLFLMNNMCMVYQIYPASNKYNGIIMASSDNIGFKTHINLYKGGLVIAECNGYLRYYKKMAKDWMEQWCIELSDSITSTFCYNMEHLVLGFMNRNLMKLVDDSDTRPPKFELIAKCDMAIKYFSIINPNGDYVATVNTCNELCLVEITVDKIASTLTLDDISSMTGHPKLPMIAYGSKNGYVYLLSFYEPELPSYLSKFYLTTFTIESIRYSPSGRTIISFTGDKSIFVMQYRTGGRIYVTNHIPLSLNVLHLTVLDNQLEVHIIALTKKPDDESNGIYSDHILQFSISDNNCTTNEITLNDNYTSIEYLSDKFDKLLAVPFKKKEFEIITLLPNSKDSLKTTATVPTSHLLKHLDIQVYSTFFVTFGLDGLVYVWDSGTLQVICAFCPHNKFFGGVRKCVADSRRRYFITLGSSNNLVCTELSTKFHDISAKSLQSDAVSGDMKKSISINLSTNSEDKTWLQLKLEDEIQEERLAFQDQRDRILVDLKRVKEKLKKIIDDNEVVPENTKLDIKEFNLNEVETQKLLEEAESDRLDKEEFLTKFCYSQNKITELILSSTWDSIDVKGTTLRGFFTKLKVENFALIKSDKEIEKDLRRVILYERAENFVSQGDMFEPWIPKTTSQLEIGLSKFPSCMEGTTQIDENAIDENTNDEVQQNPNYVTSLSGTRSHLYIQPISVRYNQMEVVTYQQMFAEIVTGFHDTLKLRQYFNKIFEKMMKTKEYEINLVKKRNERLRYIQREKNALEKLKISSTVEHYSEIIDPEYRQDEFPESIIKVADSEIGVTPYITEAEQKLLDEKNEEALRRYRELMADNFPDRALDVMMNGVLEQKWEDEIKKDPPLPECLATSKDPKNYTAADLASITQYEKQVENINNERQKYFDMLNDEENMIDGLLEKQVKSFNSKIGETFLQKMDIEFCIGCEELKLLRYHLQNFNRQLLSKKENILCKEMQDMKFEIDTLTKTHVILEELFLSCRTKYEELNERNRILDKQFKSNFLLSAPTQAVVDQAYRVFRRRPKWIMRAWQTAAILQDMAKRVNIADCSTNGPPLPEVCFAHLESLDKVDKFSNAPNLMDQTNWPILCKMRREKIEVEFKVRSCGVLLAEAEASANAFAKEINVKKQKLAQFDAKLDDIRDEQKTNLINRSLQICLKGGAVEIPLTGSMKDFHTAVLLHESDVYEINEIIRKAGNKKLRVMESAAVFRRKIIHKEWQHQTLRIKMRNKQDDIKCIEKSKITKEVQNWLQYKKFAKGENISKTDLELERESIYARLEISCREVMRQIELMDAKIIQKKIEASILDRRIQIVNLDVAELNLKRNIESEETSEKEKKNRLALLVERSRLVKQVQKQHAKILELTTMLELQRLKTYPTLNLQSSN